MTSEFDLINLALFFIGATLMLTWTYRILAVIGRELFGTKVTTARYG